MSATLISDLELRTVLCDPAELYAAITSWSHYAAKAAVVDGDCELILTDMVAKGRIVLCTMVHRERKAYLSLLSADDASSFREQLGEAIFEMNSAIIAETMTRRRRTRI